jgi:hypothetical protein
MEDSPSESGLQGLISNHRKLRSSKARVVSVTEKAYAYVRCGVTEMKAIEPLMKYRKRRDDIKTEEVSLPRDQSGRSLLTVQSVSGIKAAPT